MLLWSLALGCGSDQPSKPAATSSGDADTDVDTDTDTDTDADLDSADSGASSSSGSSTGSTSTESPVDGRWVGDCVVDSFEIPDWSATVDAWSIDVTLHDDGGTIKGHGQQTMSIQVTGEDTGSGFPIEDVRTFDPTGQWDGTTLELRAVWYPVEIETWTGTGTFSSSTSSTGGTAAPEPFVQLSGTLDGDTWTTSETSSIDPSWLSGTCTLVRQ